jgi:hypothetical protein
MSSVGMRRPLRRALGVGLAGLLLAGGAVAVIWAAAAHGTRPGVDARPVAGVPVQQQSTNTAGDRPPASTGVPVIAVVEFAGMALAVGIGALVAGRSRRHDSGEA